MSKKIKLLLIILVAPIFIIIVGIVALKLYITSDKLKALIIPPLQDATARTIEIDNISLSFLPTFGIVVDGLKISNPESYEFEKNNLLNLRKLILDVKILPLLSKKLEINKILLDNPKIYLEISRDGIKNFELKKNLPANSEHETDSVVIGESFTKMLVLSNCEIRDGELEYIDKKSNSYAHIRGYNQNLNIKSYPNEDEIRIHSVLIIDKVSYGTLSMAFLKEKSLKTTADVVYNLENDILTLDSVMIRLNELPMQLVGTIQGVQKPSMAVDIKIFTPEVQMSHLLSLISPDIMKRTQGFSSSGEMQIFMMVKGEVGATSTPSIQGTFNIKNGTIQYATLPKLITDINLDGIFEKPSARNEIEGIGKFSIEKFSATLGGNTISGRFTMKDFNEPVISTAFNGTVNLDEIKDYYPIEKGTELSGLVKVNVALEGKVKEPKGLKADGNVEFKNVMIKSAAAKNPIRNLNGIVVLNNWIIESKRFSLLLGESDLSMAFIINNYLSLIGEEKTKKAKTSASISLNSTLLKLTDLIGESTTENKKEQNTESVRTGVFSIFEIDANLNIGKFVTEKFEFTNVMGSISISDGVLNLKSLVLNAFEGTILARGMLKMNESTKRPFDLNLEIVGVDADLFLSRFTTFGNHLFGKFSTNTTILGELDDTVGLVNQSLRGNGTVKVLDGKLQGFPMTIKLADVTGINELREIDFKDWSNRFSISDGRIKIDDLRINASGTDFFLSGSQGLDGSLDYTLNVKLPAHISDRLRLEEKASQLMQFFKDKDGRVSLNFDVLGTTANPTLRLNLKEQEEKARGSLEQEQKKLIDKGKKKIEEELKKKKEEGLKKLLRKG